MFEFINKLLRTSSQKHDAVPVMPAESVTYTVREGKSAPVDSVFRAWTSGDINAMLAEVMTKTNLIDRHFLLLGIVEQTYKLRSETEMRSTCVKFAKIHLSEFKRIEPVLKKEMDGILPRVPTFQYYATLLAEDGAHDEAIEVCKTAIAYGLHDNTVSGFEGRISRIEKQRTKI